MPRKAKAKPKSKPHKGMLKRSRVTASGLVRHRIAGHKHLRSGKTGKRLRQMRRDPYMVTHAAKRLEKMLYRRLRGRDQARQRNAAKQESTD